MLEPKKVRVNGREYTVIMFDPMTAFDFFMELENAKTNQRPYGHLGKRAIGQCRTPGMGKSLDDDETFQTHFSLYPADMLPLMGGAMEALSAPFAKRDNDTSATAKD